MRIWAHRGCSQMYPKKPTNGLMDLERLTEAGVTDVFLNEPEWFL